jgi:outer membrane receptor protein involved in Fe transport
MCTGGAFSSTTGSTSQAANLTDFLFGARNNYSLNAYNEINYERYWHMGYIQDDWKVLPKLTINAGLRYEFVSPNYEQNNNLLNYDPVNQRLLHAGSGTDVTSTATGHIYTLHYVGGNSLYDRGLVNPDYKDFGPRLGFSYQAFRRRWFAVAMRSAMRICSALAARACWATTDRTTMTPRSTRHRAKGCA